MISTPFVSILVDLRFPLVSLFYLVWGRFVSSPFPARFPSFPVSHAYTQETGNEGKRYVENNQSLQPSKGEPTE